MWFYGGMWEIYSICVLFFLQIWRERMPLLYVYCVSFALCCIFILISLQIGVELESLVAQAGHNSLLC